MLFKQHILDGIAAGRITVAFRRWQRPTVKAGGSLKTSAGLLQIVAVKVISTKKIDPRDVTAAGFSSLEDLLATIGNREGRLYRIEFRRAGDDPRIALREDDQLSAADLADLQTRLARLDKASKIGPWTERVLRLVERHPERRSADLAKLSRLEQEWLKLNIRKLKNLGLTESLEIGYRISPRGLAYLAVMKG